MALWLLTTLVAWTWAAGGAIQQLLSGDTVLILRAAGHLAALLASALLLVQIVLMARLPALENTIGRDRIVRLHGKVGFSSFTLILAHIAIATLAYAGADVDRATTTFWHLTWTYPGMLLAVLGTVAIIVVVLTSPRIVRNRLNYESWHLLHLYAYLGAGLALPHQLWTGKDFLRSPILTDLWWAAWALTFAVILLWRLLIPLVRSIRHDVRVAGVVREGPRTVSVYMTGRRLDELAEPGQFLVWRFMDRPGWIRANPFSISAAPRPDRLRITVRESGDGTRSLATLEPGTRVLVEGAYGRLTARARTHPKVAFIGAGAGLAPLRSLAEGLAYAPGEAILLERCGNEPYLPQELDWLAETRGLRLVRLSGKRRRRTSWVGEGYDGASDSDVIRRWVPDLAERDVYVCGPPRWAKSVRRALRKAGLPPDQLHVESFG
ncbi:MAG: ferric reductase-like transmembrane domain-containing protein [Nocardioides sp.]|nr:ferric reductase-like transmembrane domain-containing protein [Nocardioides sp.]